MYATCLFCHSDLGANESIRSFPVGRRLAFDSGRGRLWVVCRKCERWNLSPLDERWEAVEEGERLFRDSRLRVSTDNIGLARLKEGLELVRIGEPQRPEMAAWRYGDQFGRRRRRTLMITGGIIVGAGLIVSGGLAVGAISAGSIGGLFNAINSVRTASLHRRVIARIPSSTGQVVIKGGQVRSAALVSTVDEQRWGIAIKPSRHGDRVVLTGEQARSALGAIMAHTNSAAGSKSQVQTAVKILEDAGAADSYITLVAGSPLARDAQHSLARLGAPQRLALEMAAHEESERRALEGELALLEQAWKDAEEIAAISDNLLIPKSVEDTVRAARERAEPRHD
jgi:hypothetical protein